MCVNVIKKINACINGIKKFNASTALVLVWNKRPGEVQIQERRRRTLATAYGKTTGHPWKDLPQVPGEPSAVQQALFDVVSHAQCVPWRPRSAVYVSSSYIQTRLSPPQTTFHTDLWDRMSEADWRQSCSLLHPRNTHYNVMIYCHSPMPAQLLYLLKWN